IKKSDKIEKEKAFCTKINAKEVFEDAENETILVQGIIDLYAIDKNNNKYILMFFDGNVGRLKRFKQASYDSAKNNFEVLCFPWQANFIKEYMEDNVTCRILSIDDIEEIFK
ncbi:hypothetical protein, partial [Thomasclavelia cocleata]|uniref:hypothetical protein n=1 Tax=Thomasclavelia cocleata TaxID=69824 RepID=UPI00256EE29C